ncbi:MAG: UPF0182 family protein [Candidatus Aenigmarchaeota archaeon]|nr:UPF0182 family protein [Candidatus Aenigmarchaeota archaeon]
MRGVGRVILAVLVIFFVILSIVMSIYADLFWFLMLGYENVFLTILFTRLELWFLFFSLFFIFALVNIGVAKRTCMGKGKKKRKTKTEDRITIMVSFFISVIIGSVFSNWEVVLRYLNQVPFQGNDPVFGLNIGFYVFDLPLYSFLIGFAAATVVLTLVITFISYAVYSQSFRKQEPGENAVLQMPNVPSYTIDMKAMEKKVVPHASFLIGLLFIVISVALFFGRYGLLFSPAGVVFGAGYTDIHIMLPLITLLSVVAFIVGILFILNFRMNRTGLILKLIGGFIAIAVLGMIVSGVTQAFIVTPNEYNLESEYIGRNINFTLAAYGLDSMNERIFPISYNLSGSDIEKNSGTIDNIRLWDWRPLMITYNQLQLFRTYYSFWDVDIDRYKINGGYKEVMLSARGLDTGNLPEKAKTWINEHMVYTHGYGLVMNPVDKVTADGQPEFYMQDIPPKSDYFTVDRPEIYYGEGMNEYALVKTTTEEFDYPSGEQNIYTSYEGTGGVPLSDGFRRLVYAVNFGSIELLLSGSLTEESRVLMYRDIGERVSSIAPFLSYDRDPYIVLSNGRLYWMLDAYTTTDMYPYSEPMYVGKRSYFNYIRNSVKVVVDAYNGDVTFYVIDSDDPVIKAYGKMFPGLFESFESMDPDLKDHIRYPEDLFSIQAALYSEYHMNDPRVFYNKEDTWVIPNEIYRGSRQEMQPYYVIVRLPGYEKEKFILMIPFIPRGKENLIGWMAAVSDFPDYGNLVVYKFSKQELTYGPMQIEARIDQDTEISQLITLWSQAGSDVIRGNTLVIPIEDSIVYIEPLYLEATEKGTLPELKRVIVVYGNDLVMKDTLADALADVFGSVTSVPQKPPAGLPTTSDETLSQISDLYGRAQSSLRTGDLKTYAEYMEQIEQLLENWKSS